MTSGGAMKLAILCSVLATCAAAPVSQSMSLNEDGSYQFFYETGDDGGRHSRTESRGPDGVIVGRYSYEDPSGELREVHYRADNSGFVAKGDVGVEGAPKGQFPAEVPDTEDRPVENAVAPDDQPQEQDGHGQDKKNLEEQEVPHDFALEDHLEDRPPEAFPQGFFLEKFTGLRRLPEPTTADESPTTTEAPPAEEADSASNEDDQKAESAAEGAPVPPGGVANFHQLRPFPRLSAQEWAASMFHQPVHVYSYQKPDAYGYHYFF